MRIAASIRWLLLLLLLTGGCRASSHRRDLVEAELRTKERLLRESQADLERTRLMNQALEQEFVRRGTPVGSGTNPSVIGPKDIKIGNGTGGINDDRLPGDEALMVVVVPRDEDGNPVRAIGSLAINVWEIQPGGMKTPLSSWEISPDDLRRTWKSGLLGSGYQVTLNWKKPPTQDRLRIAAQLTLPDGRMFEADKDVPIRPLPMMSPEPLAPAPAIDEGPKVPGLLPPRPTSVPND